MDRPEIETIIEKLHEATTKLITEEHQKARKDLAATEQRWSRKYDKLEQKLAAVRQVEKEKAERRLAKRLNAASKMLGGIVTSAEE